MKFLLYKNIKYKSKLNPAEIVQRLKENTEHKNSSSLFLSFSEFTISFSGFSFRSSNRYSKPYIGQIDESEFTLKRVIHYRNSVLPIIKGTIHKDFDGTTINVQMRLHTSMIVFFCIWCGIVGFMGIGTSLHLFNFPDTDIATIGPFVMLLFGVLIIIGAFQYESNKSTHDLIEILDAEIIEE